MLIRDALRCLTRWRKTRASAMNGRCYRVTRREVKSRQRPTHEESEQLALYLAPDSKVPVGGKPLELIKDKVIPRVGKADPVEATSAWRRRYRFRAGCEGRISHLKRRGLRRARLKGYIGAQIWAGYGVLAHNLDRIVALQ